MAITLTDNRTIADQADTTTGWTSPAGVAVFTSQPDPAEATGCIAIQVSNETQYVYFTMGTPVNMSGGMLVYVWILASGTMDTIVNGGITLLLGDGNNRIGYHIAGSDVAAFRHSDGPVMWMCLVVDTSSLPTTFTEYDGAETSLDLTSIVDIGAGFITLAKSLGGTENCFIDILRYGNDGLTVTGGTSVDAGAFLEIATADRSVSDQAAHGIIHELGAGLYGLQGPLTFGDSAGTGATYFADENVTLVFEDRGIATTRYYINVVSNGTGETTFKLGLQIGTSTSGSDGCTLICPAGVGASFDAADTDVEYVYIFGSSLQGFENGVLFSADATNGPNHEIYGSSFIGCGQVDPGKTKFKNNSIAGSTDGATGAMLLDADGTTNISDISFTSPGTGHAIYITATGTYDFTNFTYSGYGADGTTDAVVYNNSGGAVTINVSGGDSPTVRNGTGASTTVNNTVTVTLTGMKDNTEVRVYEQGTTTEIAGIEDATDGAVDDRYWAFSTGGGAVVDIRIFNVNWVSTSILNYTVPSSNTSLPVTQVVDRVYDNPV